MEVRNNQYGTLMEAINTLQKRGYTHNFSIDEDGRMVEGSHRFFHPSQVVLHEFHRFEGMTNPSDMSILYVVETDSGLKGTIVDSYGVNGTDYVSAFMNKVHQCQFRKTKK